MPDQLTQFHHRQTVLNKEVKFPRSSSVSLIKIYTELNPILKNILLFRILLKELNLEAVKSVARIKFRGAEHVMTY